MLTADDDRAESSSGDGTVDINEMVKRFSKDEMTGKGSRNIFAEDVLANLDADEALECPICLDMMETPMIIPDCMHRW